MKRRKEVRSAWQSTSSTIIKREPWLYNEYQVVQGSSSNRRSALLYQLYVNVRRDDRLQLGVDLNERYLTSIGATT